MSIPDPCKEHEWKKEKGVSIWGGSKERQSGGEK